MLTQLSRNWWVLVAQGVLAIIFGIMAWVWPAATVLVLVILFGAYTLVEGIFAIVAAVKGTDRNGRGWLAFIGIASVIIGLIALFWPGVTALVLLYIIAVWAIVRGVITVYGAIRLRKELQGEWVLILSGAISVIFGLLLMFWPVSGVLAVIWLIGVYAIFLGIMQIVLGFRVKGRHGRIEEPTGGVVL
ncbi:HdeD family acid-resistance protein [Phytomonospora sp. NPDC050363]|uniref:HdeD family acid-resistance protein n=1 Tax=Phytomonospora sp. NPDC050363 TaxID=3155642 RepID=UPI0033F67580